jgi:putative transposase
MKFEKERYYHITNRGLLKRKLFFNHKDYRRFLERLKYYKRKFDIDIALYCLMPNHYHLIMRPESGDDGLQFIKFLQMSYAKYFNIKYDRKGQTFEGRYRLELLDSQQYLVNTMKYIINNPIKAGLVEKAEDWPYLSFRESLLSGNPGVNPGVEITG